MLNHTNLLLPTHLGTINKLNVREGGMLMNASIHSIVTCTLYVKQFPHWKQDSKYKNLLRNTTVT